MDEIIVDAVGEVCPKPVILTKTELDKISSGTVKTKVDDDICVENIKRYAEGQGYDFDFKQTDYGFETTVVKKEGQASEVEGKVTKNVNNGKLVVAISTDTMGKGDEKLGEKLAKSFIYSMSETDPAPDTLIFYNSGIKFTTEGSEVLDDLKKLEEKGTTIMTCGTCLDYYEKKDQLAIGVVSNMYEIYEQLSQADRNIIIR
ncbi:MAG: sulfurtransferase-like selenium metabolism protein YedF [Finegoldia sp.]|nr:sulfurtransferase-like selenium metabolism protein YedF [Finegoldia sp.]